MKLTYNGYRRFCEATNTPARWASWSGKISVYRREGFVVCHQDEQIKYLFELWLPHAGKIPHPEVDPTICAYFESVASVLAVAALGEEYFA